MFEPYANKSGRSGVIGYAIDDDEVRIYYRDSSWYRYTCRSCGRDLLEEMKIHAQRGYGLNGFINKYVGEDFEERYRP